MLTHFLGPWQCEAPNKLDKLGDYQLLTFSRIFTLNGPLLIMLLVAYYEYNIDSI